MDLLSDVGGLFGAIQPFCYVLILIFQYHGAYTYVLSDLTLNKTVETDLMQSLKRSLNTDLRDIVSADKISRI